MAIKLVSWNIEGRLSRFAQNGRGSPEHILRSIEEKGADIVFLAEASDGDDIDGDVKEKIEALGYQTYTVDYEDAGKDRRWAAVTAPNMKLLSRIPVKRFKLIRLGNIRNALSVEVLDADTGSPLRIYGVHLDDRSETYRLKQIHDLLEHVSKSDIPTVVMGDFNAMHADDFRARVLQIKLFRSIVNRFPHARTKDMLQRLSEMAKGDSLAMLEEGSTLTDADISHGATTTPKLRFQEWMPSVRMVQIDHIYITSELKVVDFTIGCDGGSDHRPLAATVTLRSSRH